MNTENTALKQEELFPLRPCAQCGKVMPRKVYKGVPESPSKYAERVHCSRACYRASCQPPPDRKCPICKKILVQRENESVTEFRGRDLCSKACATKAFQLKAKKARFKKMQRRKCAVRGCKRRVDDGLIYLCREHFENADDVPENPQGSLPEQRDLSYAHLWPIIERMRRNLSKRVLTFTWAEYKQDELEFYLMTPAERREARRNYDRQEQSER